MNLALHRSLTFWSGILVMAFIVWAWRDSVLWNSFVNKGAWTLNNSSSGVSVYYVPPPTSYGKGRINRFRTTSAFFAHQVLPSVFFVRGAGVPREPIEVGPDGSVLGPPEHKVWQADMQAARSLRKLREISMRHRPIGDWMLFIPYWLLLLAVALPWSALLLWRARRRKRAALTNT